MLYLLYTVVFEFSVAYVYIINLAFYLSENKYIFQYQDRLRQ
jgi:hypothetical protein